MRALSAPCRPNCISTCFSSSLFRCLRIACETVSMALAAKVTASGRYKRKKHFDAHEVGESEGGHGQ